MNYFKHVGLVCITLGLIACSNDDIESDINDSMAQSARFDSSDQYDDYGDDYADNSDDGYDNRIEKASDAGHYGDSDHEIVLEGSDYFCTFEGASKLSDKECIADASGMPMNSVAKGHHIVTVTISDNESLNQAGIQTFTVVINVPKGHPKLQAKAYDVSISDFSSRTNSMPEAMFPVDVNVMVNQEQTDYMKQLGASPAELPLYQLDDVAFNISKIEDIPLHEDDEDMAKLMGAGESGKQIFEGSLKVSLSTLNPSAKSLPSLTAKFKDELIWYFNPDF